MNAQRTMKTYKVQYLTSGGISGYTFIPSQTAAGAKSLFLADNPRCHFISAQESSETEADGGLTPDEFLSLPKAEA